MAFGAPTVLGTPTWVIKGRYDAGEAVQEIAEDFDLKPSDVKKALAFEAVAVGGHGKKWDN